MGSKISWKILLALIILLPPICETMAQTPERQIISGVVLSGEDHLPLTGVSVMVKSTNQGTITDIDGNYSISVNSNDVLSFSFIGFKAQEVAVNKGNFSRVVLEPNSELLDEVVVVGYGTMKKVNLTGSVATMDGGDLLDRPITQTSQALQGKMAGVTVTSGFGMPGSDSGTIRIRGIGTLGSKDPMVLIDGIEGSINDITPADIENISVLKDAASASIYGSRAANGVILITTKKARKGDTMSVTYNGMVGIQKPTRLPKIVNGETYMMLKNESERNQGRSDMYSEAYIQEYIENKGTEPFFDTNWFDEVVKSNSLQHQHSVSIRGGSEKISSYASVSFLQQDALIDNADFKRMSIRYNTTYQVNEKLSFSINSFLRRQDSSQPNVPGGGSGNRVTELFRMVSEIPAIYPAMWEDGTIGEGWNGDNPLGYIKGGARYRSHSSRILLNLRAKYQFTDWIGIEFAYAPKYLITNNKTTTKHYAYKRIDGSTGERPQGRNGLNNSNSRSLENFYQGIINYGKEFGKHNTAAILGFEAVDYRSDNFWASRQNFMLPQYEVLDAGDENFKDNGGNASEWALASFFGRVNYSFADRYLLEANLRYDGSSKFARNNRWGWFPSFSAGWRINEENFLKDVDFISALKLRVSWGTLGNQNIGNYPYQGVVALNQPYYFNDMVVTGAAQTVLPNTNVTWETSKVLNFGIDYSFFNNRLSGSLDVYKKNTVDILYKRDVPSLIGLSASEQNIAEVQNVGWDLQLSWNDKINRFRYGVDFVLSDVRNKVVNLNGLPQYGRNVIFEGEEYQAFYGYECIGIYRTEEDLARYPAINTNVGLGDLIFKDQDGGGVVDADDKIIMGSTIPRYTFGTTINLGYMNWDLNIFFQGVGKKDLYYRVDEAAYGGTYQKYQLARYVPDDPSTHQTASWIKMGGPTSNRDDNSFYLYNAAYIRCKNITLGYTLPDSLLGKIGIKGFRIYGTAHNLFTIDRLPINTIDPEAPSSSTGASYYPNTKSFVIGIDLKF